MLLASPSAKLRTCPSTKLRTGPSTKLRTGLAVPGPVVNFRVFSVAAAFAGVVLGLSAQAAEDCPRADLLEPAAQTISDSRPTLVWQPLPGVSRYRLRLQSRVPEGEIKAAIDTLVDGTQFTPPRPLADHRAVVKLLVTVACDAPPSLDTGRRIFIDTGLSCRMAPLELDEGTGLWSWPQVSGAVGYDVYRYAMPDGRLLSREETPRPTSFSIDSAVVVAVRARCANGYSDWKLAP